MNILEGFSKKDDLVEFICTKCKYIIWVPRFIAVELEEDNLLEGLNKSIPPQPFCQNEKCDGIMTPVSYTGIRGVKFQYDKD